MAFYHPRAVDPAGGFFQNFKDDGTIYDTGHRHLVSSTRFVFNYARAFREFGEQTYLKAVHHGIDYLRKVHRDPKNGGYAWTIRDGRAEDRTNHCYGVAFVLLAYTCARQVGISEAAAWMDETWALLEKYFWDAQAGLYRDEASPDWVFTDYRGQNANMHMCEAMLAAFEASGEHRYLERAYTLADHMTRRQAQKAKGLVWEHYDKHWEPDWQYNRDNPKHLFRPWGFQAGHQTEWAKLLLILERHKPEPWLLPRARELFDTALARAWDSKYKGIYYGFTPDGKPCDTDKYFWVQAETLAAAVLLAVRSGEQRYWNWYDAIWSYAWRHFVDHEYGGWYRILDRENRKYSDEKSPAGKVDYHTMGACYEVLKLTTPH
ncbi:MAG: AGE family epimerase/isomerase [Gammaproteobacteria bacterium]